MSSEVEPTDVDFFYQLIDADIDIEQPDLKIRKCLIIAIADDKAKAQFQPLLKWLKKDDSVIVTGFDDVYVSIWLVSEEVARKMRGL